MYFLLSVSRLTNLVFLTHRSVCSVIMCHWLAFLPFFARLLLLPIMFCYWLRFQRVEDETTMMGEEEPPSADIRASTLVTTGSTAPTLILMLSVLFYCSSSNGGGGMTIPDDFRLSSPMTCWEVARSWTWGGCRLRFRSERFSCMFVATTWCNRGGTVTRAGLEVDAPNGLLSQLG